MFRSLPADIRPPRPALVRVLASEMKAGFAFVVAVSSSPWWVARLRPGFSFMALTTLKPRVQMLRTQARTIVVERIRGRANQRRRERLLSAQPLCVHCEREGRTTLAVEIDHHVPLWMGGSEDDSNLAGLCGPCHRMKSAKEAAVRYQK